MFVNKAISELKVLHAAVSTNDVAEIWRLADSLKSGSANLGAQQMTAVYEQLYGTSSTNVDSQAFLNRIDLEFELVRKLLKSEPQEIPG
jgi:HPt (histidine-containing phosphotransfer) domain-containing protein